MIAPMPPGPRASAELLPRYEDVTQDGRLLLHAMMPGLGAAAWRPLLDGHPLMTTFQREAILPILRRLVAERHHPGPLSVHVPLRCEGTFQVARETAGERLFMNIWVDVTAAVATTFGPPPPPDAPRILVGRIFAEHVMTRPFGPKENRRVTKLDVDGTPFPIDVEHRFVSAEDLVADAGVPLRKVREFAFGMLHTDSNQHVNSLVYPRAFEDAAITDLGDPKLLARTFEVRWHKPFFAGDRAAIAMHVAPGDGEATAFGSFAKAGDEDARVHATLRMTLSQSL